MGGMTFLILLVVFLAVVNRGRRRWYRGWDSAGQHFPSHGGPPWTQPQVSTPRRADLESYVDSLESRVAQLEERLDFTERLLTGSKGPVNWKTQPASSASDDLPQGHIDFVRMEDITPTREEGQITHVRRDE
jgi:hypothetical protein